MSFGRFSVLALAVAARGLAGGFVVQPPHIYEVAAGGTKVEKTISIVSTSDAPSPLTFAVAAFDISSTGKPVYDRDAAHDLLSSIQLSARSAVLQPHGRVDLIARIDVPEPARVWWAALLIDREDGDVTARIAIPIFVTTAGTPRSRVSMHVERAFRSGDQVVIAAVLENHGEALIRAPVLASVERGEGIEVASGELSNVVLLPWHSRVVEVRLHGTFESARLIAWALFRYGPSPADTAEDSAAVAASVAETSS